MGFSFFGHSLYFQCRGAKGIVSWQFHLLNHCRRLMVVPSSHHEATVSLENISLGKITCWCGESGHGIVTIRTKHLIIDYAHNKRTSKTMHPNLLGCMHTIIFQFLLTEGVEGKTGVRLMGCMAEPTLLQIIYSFLIVLVVENRYRHLFFLHS